MSSMSSKWKLSELPINDTDVYLHDLHAIFKSSD